MNTWLKLFFKLRITKDFGPLFKVIQKMFLNLFKFLIIWTLEIFIFASMSNLIFIDTAEFSNFYDTI
jgi:hypothetical protein